MAQVPNRVPVASDVLRDEIAHLAFAAGNSWDLALAPFRQSRR
jgi:hypothetical protein